jgi:hypothetical protein
MAGPGKFLQIGHIFYRTGTERVQMNVPDKLKKVRVLLTEKRFVPILKKMSGAAIPSIELQGIAGEQSAHHG